MEAERQLGEYFSYSDKGHLAMGTVVEVDKWTKLISILEAKSIKVAERLDLGYEGQE